MRVGLLHSFGWFDFFGIGSLVKSCNFPQLFCGLTLNESFYLGHFAKPEPHLLVSNPHLLPFDVKGSSSCSMMEGFHFL
jgi:hypothetical protein